MKAILSGLNSGVMRQAPFRTECTRSEEHVPLLPQNAEVQHQRGDDSTRLLDSGGEGVLTNAGRMRTFSLTSDASSRRSKDIDSGNSSLMDSSSTDSCHEFCDIRSRTISTSKSEQNLAADLLMDAEELREAARNLAGSVQEVRRTPVSRAEMYALNHCRRTFYSSPDEYPVSLDDLSSLGHFRTANLSEKGPFDVKNDMTSPVETEYSFYNQREYLYLQRPRRSWKRAPDVILRHHSSFSVRRNCAWVGKARVLKKWQYSKVVRIRRAFSAGNISSFTEANFKAGDASDASLGGSWSETGSPSDCSLASTGSALIQETTFEPTRNDDLETLHYKNPDPSFSGGHVNSHDSHLLSLPDHTIPCYNGAQPCSASSEDSGQLTSPAMTSVKKLDSVLSYGAPLAYASVKLTDGSSYLQESQRPLQVLVPRLSHTSRLPPPTSRNSCAATNSETASCTKHLPHVCGFSFAQPSPSNHQLIAPSQLSRQKKSHVLTSSHLNPQVSQSWLKLGSRDAHHLRASYPIPSHQVTNHSTHCGSHFASMVHIVSDQDGCHSENALNRTNYLENLKNGLQLPQIASPCNLIIQSCLQRDVHGSSRNIDNTPICGQIVSNLQQDNVVSVVTIPQSGFREDGRAANPALSGSNSGEPSDAIISQQTVTHNVWSGSDEPPQRILLNSSQAEDLVGCRRHKNSRQSAGYNSEIPDYRLLCLAAAIFNPIFGVLAYICNYFAVSNFRHRRLNRANNLYLITIAVSTSGIFLSLIALSLLAANAVASGRPHGGSSINATGRPCYVGDDSYLRFYELNLDVYCQIVGNDVVMQALKKFYLFDGNQRIAHQKRLWEEQERRNNLTATSGNSAQVVEGREEEAPIAPVDRLPNVVYHSFVNRSGYDEGALHNTVRGSSDDPVALPDLL